ncbi:spliceosome-associated protein CWC15 homolog [Watersipora subatra]|uniref:spliceosome-associated protein CWC15 homolog n=1 Tax=Watersipora subatra TaxID=2589382 RepID=UPI00355B4513
MTTAARPTFEPARGGSGKGETDLSALSKQYSSRDLPGHTKLKYRQDGQNSSIELKGRDFRRDLDERERAAREKRTERDYSSSSSKRARIEHAPSSHLDDDDPIDQDEGSDSDSSDDEDDTAELMAELARIKKERQQEILEKEQEKKQEEERIRTENILRGNPLLNKGTESSYEFKVKRRWDDDVVFKNCAKMEDDKKKVEFINDTLRSEFHRKFMSKYIK